MIFLWRYITGICLRLRINHTIFLVINKNNLDSDTCKPNSKFCLFFIRSNSFTVLNKLAKEAGRMPDAFRGAHLSYGLLTAAEDRGWRDHSLLCESTENPLRIHRESTENPRIRRSRLPISLSLSTINYTNLLFPLIQKLIRTNANNTLLSRRKASFLLMFSGGPLCVRSLAARSHTHVTEHLRQKKPSWCYGALRQARGIWGRAAFVLCVLNRWKPPR